MRFSLAAALLTSVVSVLAADHLVLVGDNSTLTFSPSSVQAAQGDSVIFEFRSKNHSVTQSTFANPCSLMTTPKTGVDSGFQATSNTTTTFAQWKITIDNATAPLWFFCAQTNPKNHCQAGMVFAVNPTADKSFNAYLQNAMNSANSTAPGASTGSSSAGGASATVAGASSAGASSATVAGASSVTAASSAGSAVSMVTSIGSVPTNSVPAPNTGLSGAAVTALGSNTANATETGAPSSAMRIGGSASGLLVAGLVASLIL